MAATEEPHNTITSEIEKTHAFSASELVLCRARARTNPPTRVNCLYCGAALDSIGANAMQPTLSSQPETSAENLFHVVCLSSVEPTDNALRALMAMSNFTSHQLNLLSGQRFGAPLLAAKSEKDAQIACDKLRTAGVETMIVTAEQLALDGPHRQIGALEFEGESLIGIVRRTGESISVRWRDVSLMVAGRLYFATTEIEQKRNRSRDSTDERELVTDEAVLDLYFREADAGWRILVGGFDFSCLGSEKKLTALENFTTLTQRLRDRATNALFDESYLPLRSLLNDIWPIESRAVRKTRRRTGFSDYDSSATISDNNEQFTRYSKMLRFLTLKHLIGDADKT